MEHQKLWIRWRRITHPRETGGREEAAMRSQRRRGPCEGGNDVRGGGLGPGLLLHWFAGLAHAGRAAKLDLSFAPHPGYGAFSVSPQQCTDGKSRPNKHRIPSKSWLGGEFLSSPGYQTRPKYNLQPYYFMVLIKVWFEIIPMNSY
jgi:hypothetical protein